MYLNSKQMKPALGALSIVGKDRNGRVLLVPTEYDCYEQSKANIKSLLKKKDRWGMSVSRGLVSFFNKVLFRKVQKKVYKLMTAKQAKLLVEDYHETVAAKLAPLRYGKELIV